MSSTPLTSSTGFAGDAKGQEDESSGMTWGTILPIVFSVGMVLLTIVYFMRQGQKVKRDTILIVGPAGSGKTALFSRLFLGEGSRTITSMTVNEGRWPAPEETEGEEHRGLRLIDLPGHSRLQGNFARETPRTCTIIFTLDASTLSRDVRSTADNLYDILSNRSVEESEIPILIVGMKRDVLTALKAERMRVLLEGEIEKLRVTRATAPESLEEEGEEEAAGAAFLGYEGEAFRFEQLGNAVHFCEAESVTEEGYLPVQRWLEEHAPTH